MKKLLFLSLFLICLSTGYGQVSKTKQTTRLPVDSTTMLSSSKGRNAQVIDGSQNVQTLAGGQTASANATTGGQAANANATASGQAANANATTGGQAANPYAMAGGLQLPERFRKDATGMVRSRLAEPQSVFIERKRPQSQLRSSIVGGGHRETAFTFFKETPQLKIANPELQIRIDTIETDRLNMTHVKGKQLYRDTPVYGMNFTFHVSDESERFMGYTVDSTYFNTDEAQLSADDAIRIAESDLSQTTVIRPPSAKMKELLKYEKPTVEAIYYPTKTNTYNYSYKVIIRPNFRDEWIYYIDAYSGEVVNKNNNTPTDGPNTGTGNDLNGTQRTVNTYLEEGVHYMVNTTKPMFNEADFSGVIGVYDAKNDMQYHEDGVAYLTTNTSSSWNNPTAISAMYHCTLVYEYLQNTFKRNSFDGKGSSMQAIINVCDDETGGGYDNAYWNGAIIALGNGRVLFKPLAGGLDVIAHEFGHAVISKSANLEYHDQPGAINEAYADIFGVMVDRSNWTIGETIIPDKRYYSTGIMRDMRNPHNGGTSRSDRGWQPAHLSEMYLGTDDHGGVHVNNSIPAHTFYVYATTTSKERAEQVYYRALTSYLTPTSKFIDFRKAIIQSAKDLNYSSDVKIIEDAFDKVGIVDDAVNNQPPPPPPPPADLPTNPGDWGMLMCNTDEADHNSLYKTSDYKTYIPISTTEMYSTPSVTDDGKYTIFVDNKYNIRLLDMTTGQEETINDEGDNQSVAVSRDGNRIAVISTYEDGRIWVLDISTNQWMAFKLYNPTTGTGGAKSGGPRFADAIEFDHSGEYLIYDAYNVAGSSIGGRTVDYWDIGLIHVWNNSRNTWGTGEVVKLFSDLTSGVNVFNPVFSKNSPFIIAFDYYDEEDDENYTVGVNLAAGTLEPMITNNMPSYPSYSMDDKHLSFTTYNYDGKNNYNVGYFNLGSDKISVTGDVVVFATGAAFPVYYGTGTRVLGAPPVASFVTDDRTGGAPLLVQFVDMSDGNPTSWNWSFPGGTPSSSTQQHPAVVYKTPGTYAVTLSATNSYGSGEVVKQGYITISSDYKIGQRVSADKSTGVKQGLLAEIDDGHTTQEIITVYPNPATDYVWITGVTGKPSDIKLFDLTGKAIPVTFANEQGKTRIDLSNVTRGIYILRVTLSDGNVQISKIIKN